MKVALYARESEDDTNKAPPIENQLEAFMLWVENNQHQVIEKYMDDGFSGGDWNRPAWLQCVKDAKRHQYQILWVWNQDRLARDTEQFLWFYRNINEAKVKIWEETTNDWIDMTSLGNRVKHQTMAQAAEIFRLVTSEKVKKAYERRKAQGKEWGRPKIKLDYINLLALRTQGMSYRDIAKELGTYKTKTGKEMPYSFQTIRRLLQNPPTNII